MTAIKFQCPTCLGYGGVPPNHCTNCAGSGVLQLSGAGVGPAGTRSQSQPPRDRHFPFGDGVPAHA